MNEKFNINAKFDKFTTMLGIAVRLIVIDPYDITGGIQPPRCIMVIIVKTLQILL